MSTNAPPGNEKRKYRPTPRKATVVSVNDNARLKKAPSASDYTSTSSSSHPSNFNTSSSTNKSPVRINPPKAAPKQQTTNPPTASNVKANTNTRSSATTNTTAAPTPVPPPKLVTVNVDEKWKIEFEELELEEMISSGEAGEVYLGYYFGTPVAIKKLFIQPSEAHLMEKEYRMLKDLHHPNIVQFLGLCMHETGIYLVTEYVAQGDLFDLLIFSQAEVTWADKTRIALQIAQACVYLHSKNIMHRDLKGLNVLLGENYKVKLCDLGLATEMDSQTARRTTICGTDQWMAPEILMGEPYSYPADVFSYGIVLTELITQKPPKSRSMMLGFGLDVDNFKSLIPSSCPPKFAELAIRCADSDPTKRPTFKEVVSEMRSICSSLD